MEVHSIFFVRATQFRRGCSREHFFEDLVAALWLAPPTKREEALSLIFQQEDQIALLAEKTIRKHQERVVIKPRVDPELAATEGTLTKAFGTYGERSWFP